MNADRAATAASLDNLPLDDRGDLITMPNDKRLGPGVITARDPAQRHLADHDVAESGAGLDRELVIFVIVYGRLPVIVSGPLLGVDGRMVQRPVRKCFSPASQFVRIADAFSKFDPMALFKDHERTIFDLAGSVFVFRGLNERGVIAVASQDTPALGLLAIRFVRGEISIHQASHLAN